MGLISDRIEFRFGIAKISLADQKRSLLAISHGLIKCIFFNKFVGFFPLLLYKPF